MSKQWASLIILGLASATPALAASIVGFVLLGATGWLCGQLVYAHGVGVSRDSAQ